MYTNFYDSSNLNFFSFFWLKERRFIELRSVIEFIELTKCSFFKEFLYVKLLFLKRRLILKFGALHFPIEPLTRTARNTLHCTYAARLCTLYCLSYFDCRVWSRCYGQFVANNWNIPLLANYADSARLSGKPLVINKHRVHKYCCTWSTNDILLTPVDVSFAFIFI